ncbi:MAG: bifunctional O-acetylhomoserine aminocarboxypropyltransferase/cysteine synthase [Phycisphaerales bacterium]|jgi:O-acetylhomoserine (thiol)-lyase|nr:bifunctional O-acetylhomoserine aminocarboxypropyltransferase/cysteine synthase [Phycisphaerales bacterium]MBT7171730.1 bifunctional O-acetylhomoserine aminocarboxypropyltransferase/cysteine synthase [Phycisphaerales bacterium]
MSELEFNKLGTLAVHGGYDPFDDAQLSCAPPIYPTASYMFKDSDHAADLFALKEFGNIYSRLMNPTCDVLEKRLAALDGGAAALAFASGMAAITATICTLAQAGQNIIASKNLYGGTVTLFGQTLPKLGIEVRMFDSTKPEEIAELADENTRGVYIETIANPNNLIADFRALADATHAVGVPLICDNTIATPALMRPIEHGVDIVVYSTTKYIGGHGAHIGGAVVDAATFDWEAEPEKWPQFTAPDPSYHGVVFTEALKPIGNVAFIIHMRTHWLRDTGAAMSPFAAWIMCLGIETLHLRMERHCENAQKVADWLAENPLVDWVNYPGQTAHRSHELAKKYLTGGFGGMLGFGIKGGCEAGKKFIDAVKLCRHLANVGDAKTLVIHPASTTHQQLTAEEQKAAGVSPEFVRMCVGIEDIDDIIADIDQALTASQQ